MADALITHVGRRGKYLLLASTNGCLIVHLGMSGSLRLVDADTPLRPHDHVDIQIRNARTLRFNDPRRFGCVLWTPATPDTHPLLANLGPEPLSDDFDGDHLFCRSRGRRQPVKCFVMDAHIVTGVGNIYANESLFMAGIHPHRAAGRVGLSRYRDLAAAIRRTLREAIAMGGTTLRDFVNGNGQPGYFRQQLRVYERAGLPCRVCARPVRQRRIGQRSTFYCPHCQR
jgi:formamidopyrimidine-DNA glycosylase